MKHYKKLLLMGMAALTLGACVPTQTSPGGGDTTINIGYSQLPANIHPAEDYNG
ncbi:TPA: hypothetical protein ACGOZ1_000223 [Streptococcus suis]